MHKRRGAWPERSGQTFIIAAFDAVLTTLWDLSVEDVKEDFADSTGYRVAAAQFFRSALMTGALLANVQPSNGGSLRPILATDWVPDLVNLAIATGTVDRRINGRRDAMWVFIDDGELALMRKVLSVTDMLYPHEDKGPLELLGDEILANMSAIARARRPLDSTAAAANVVKLLLPSMQPTFDSFDRISFTIAAADWLRERFNEDPSMRLDREDFERAAMEAFGPYMTGRIFDRVWREATSFRDALGKQPYKARRRLPDPHRITAGVAPCAHVDRPIRLKNSPHPARFGGSSDRARSG